MRALIVFVSILKYDWILPTHYEIVLEWRRKHHGQLLRHNKWKLSVRDYIDHSGDPGMYTTSQEGVEGYEHETLYVLIVWPQINIIKEKLKFSKNRTRAVLMTRHTALLPNCYMCGDTSYHPVTALLQVRWHVIPPCCRTVTDVVTRHTAMLPHSYRCGYTSHRPVAALLQVWWHVIPPCYRTVTGVVTRHTALLPHCYRCGDTSYRPVAALLQVWWHVIPPCCRTVTGVMRLVLIFLSTLPHTYKYKLLHKVLGSFLSNGISWWSFHHVFFCSANLYKTHYSIRVWHP